MEKIFTSVVALSMLGSLTSSASTMQTIMENAPSQGIKIIAPFGRVADKTVDMPQKAVEKASVNEEASAPEGVEKLFSTDWMCLMNNYIVDNTGIATRMRFADDGKVYIHDLFSTGMDYWVNATLENNNIVIPLHQEVATTPYGTPLTLEISTFKIEEDVMWSEIDRDATSYTLIGLDDGSYISSDLDKDWTERQYPVLCDANDGTYYLIGSLVCTQITDNLVTPPAGIEPEILSYSYFKDKFQKADLVKVVKDGNDIYIEGLAPALPDVWLKGEYVNDGNQIEFKSGQFMGASQYVHFFSAAHPNPNASIDNPNEPNWLKDDKLICDVRPDGTFEFRTDRYLTITIAGDVSYDVKPRVLARYSEAGGKPAKPVITDFVWMEVDFLAFVQPTLDVDGIYLNPENLSWRMYYDDVLFTFENWEYYNLPENMSEIPYGYDDNWDFLFYTDIGEQMVAIYNSGYRNIGIESVYRFGDKEYVSDRAYYGDAPSGIDNNEAAEKTPVESTYYDLAGRKVSTPSAGIYLRTDRYNDGSVKTRKVSVR